MNGLVCGRYRTTVKLGEGGMADVWLARHEVIEQEAAIKLLQPQMSANQEVVRRFMKEAQAAAAIKHPGIVEIYDVGHTRDGRAYIVMELLRGEPLGDRLKRQGQLAIEEATRLVRQLAGVMGAAHEKRIFHRDLKPDNLYVVPDPEVQGGERIKVLDFGLAKLATEFAGSIVTSRGAIFGTPAYMAPEQCKDSGLVDGRADLYSIGCILYRCLCGQPPFDHKEPLMLLQAQLKQTPIAPRQLRADIPAELDALIMRLLAKEPGDRVQTCAELIAALDSAPDGTATLVDDPDELETWMVRAPDRRGPVSGPRTDPHPGPHAHERADEAATLVGLDGHPSAADGIPLHVSLHPSRLAPQAETERVAVLPALLAGRAPTNQGQPQLAQPHAQFPRPGTAGAMAQGSSPLAHGLRAMSEPAPHGARPRQGRGRAWLIAGVVALVLAVLVAAALLAERGDSGSRAAPGATEPPASTDTAEDPGSGLAARSADAGSPDASPDASAPPDAAPIREDVASPDIDKDADADAREPDRTAAKKPPALGKAEIDALVAASRSAARENDYPTAYEACRKVLAGQARHAEANLLCAMSACKLGKDERTVKRYTRYLGDKEREGVARFCQLKDL